MILLPRTRPHLTNPLSTPTTYYKHHHHQQHPRIHPLLLQLFPTPCASFRSSSNDNISLAFNRNHHHPSSTSPPPSTTPKMAPIERITLFNIPDEAARDRVLEQYKILAKTAVKDGKPYILAAAAGPSFPDPRNKGFNLSVKTTFASLEDMQYYDAECEAHKELKAVVGPVKEDILTTYFESVL